MKESTFDKDLKIVREFGKEKIDGLSFEERLSGEDEYFKIIEMFFAAMLPWKKDYNKNQLKEAAIFYFRRFKAKQRKQEKQKEIEKGSTIFFPISETNIIFFEPIIKMLLKIQKACVLRFDYSLDGLKKELEKRGLPYVNFEHFLDKKTKKRINGLFHKYKKTLKIAKIIVKRNEKYKRLVPTLLYFFGNRKRFYEILEFIEGLKNFIEKTSPSIIVLPGETMDLERAVAYICRKKMIPCVFFQDGNVTFENQESPEIISTKKIVFGKLAKDFLTKKGAQNEKICITGSPLYDNFIRKKISEAEKIKIKKELGIEDKKIILFASTTNLDIAKKRLIILFKIIKENPQLKLIIKQHPGEYLIKKYEKAYLSLAKQYGVEIIISKDEMWKIMAIADIFTTEFSTTILEALLLKKPIILMDFEKFYKNECPTYKGILWHTYSQKEVSQAVKEALKNKISKKAKLFEEKLIIDNLHKQDGRACERIVNLINKLKKGDE